MVAFFSSYYHFLYGYQYNFRARIRNHWYRANNQTQRYFITGLLYGRFSKPKAKIKFSDNLILRKFKKERALMFRLMNMRKTVMIEPEIKVTLSISEKNKKGAYVRNFF